ncbi:hypothetical protein [Roseobacter weihaiensis]|uniref:hypothetical protein n=1 Tax=Roseobacter weihaiensis TaxID=2763262 RepID=UPI001D09A917|nr:hypothetical protein [Roseobacter sp. H9]
MCSPPAELTAKLSALCLRALQLMQQDATIQVRIAPDADALLEDFRIAIRTTLGVDLPDVLTIALDDPARSVMDVLTEEGLGDLDLPNWPLVDRKLEGQDEGGRAS